MDIHCLISVIRRFVDFSVKMALGFVFYEHTIVLRCLDASSHTFQCGLLPDVGFHLELPPNHSVKSKYDVATSSQ
jgi:hypothetical protein